jgi:hypothetical protein
MDGMPRLLRTFALALLAVLSFQLASPAVSEEDASETPVLFAGRSAGEFFAGGPGPVGGGKLLTGPSDWIEKPFDTVLLHGDDLDEDGSVMVARENPAGEWSDWVGAEIHRYPNGRFWAKAVFPASAPGRLKFTFLQPRGDREPRVYEIEALRITSKPTQGTGAVEPPHPGQPGTLSRAQWGAKPPKAAYDPQTPKRITQHHTSGRYPTTLEDSITEMRIIQDYHQNGRKWNDIGYHFIIDPAGRIFQGRPVGALGAHVLSNNEDNVGISLMGNYHPPKNDVLTPEQLEAIRKLGVWLREAYGISPDLYKGHRDYNAGTDCPGDGVYARLKEIRDSFRPAPQNSEPPSEGGNP